MHKTPRSVANRNALRKIFIIIYSMDLRLSNLRGTAKDREGWHAAAHGVTKSQTRLSDFSLALHVCGCQLSSLCPAAAHHLMYDVWAQSSAFVLHSRESLSPDVTV